MSEYIKLDDAVEVTCSYLQFLTGNKKNCNMEKLVRDSLRRKSILDLSDLNNYLLEVVTNSSTCQKCALRHPDNTCFFAAECIRQDFCHFRDGGRTANIS